MRRSQRLSLLLAALLAGACSTAEDASLDGAAAGDSLGGDSATAGAGMAFEGSFEGPLGIQLWSLREQIPTDVPGTLAWVKEQGFTEVETAGTYGLTPQQFRQELDRAGLRATAMHMGYERMRDSLDVALAEAEAMGARYIGVAWIPHEGAYTPEMARQTAADFNRWGAAARARGLTFFYHTHGYEFQPAADGTVPFDVLVAETDPANVAFEMDVFWVAHPGVDPAALLRKYPNRWKLMHIKDMKQGTPTGDYSGGAPPETQVPVGTGQIDYRAVLAAAAEVGVEHYYVEDESTDPVANIPQTLQFLRTVSY